MHALNQTSSPPTGRFHPAPHEKKHFVAGRGASNGTSLITYPSTHGIFEVDIFGLDIFEVDIKEREEKPFSFSPKKPFSSFQKINLFCP